MKLIYNPLGLSMDITESGQNVVVLENNDEFEKFILRLSTKIEGCEEYFLTDEETPLFFKRMKIVTSPFDLSITEREMQKKLYSYLQEEIEVSPIIEELVKAHSEMVESLEKLNVYSDFEVDFDDNFVIASVLKNMNVRLKGIEGSFCARLIFAGDVFHKLLDKDILILCNCDAYLQEDDYELIEKWCSYNNITMLFVRNQQISSPIYTNEYIIDKDLCILH